MISDAVLDCETQELTRIGDLNPIIPEWDAPVLNSPGATPFQTAAWLVPWWNSFGNGKLSVLAFRRQGRLVGIVPLFIQRDSATGARSVLPIGLALSDYLGPVFAEDFQSIGTQILFKMIEEMSADWDVCDFQNLSNHSALLQADLPAGWQDENLQQDVCPYICLDAPNTRTQTMLKRAAYDLRRLSRTGDVRITIAQNADFKEHFDALLSLHTASWKARGQPGALVDPAVQSFHRAAASNLLRLGVLRLYILSVGEQNVAGLYTLSMNHRVFSYLNGFNPEFAKFSPGTILIGHAIETALRSGAHEFDFLRGKEAYKYGWGAKDRPIFRRLIRQRQ